MCWGLKSEQNSLPQALEVNKTNERAADVTVTNAGDRKQGRIAGTRGSSIRRDGNILSQFESLTDLRRASAFASPALVHTGTETV